MGVRFQLSKEDSHPYIAKTKKFLDCHERSQKHSKAEQTNILHQDLNKRIDQNNSFHLYYQHYQNLIKITKAGFTHQAVHAHILQSARQGKY